MQIRLHLRQYQQMPKNTPDIQNSAVLEICNQIKGTNDRLDEIVKRLSKLDDIGNRLNKIDRTMAEFQTKIRNVESKTADFEQSVTFVSAKCDEFNDKCNTIDEMKTELENQASLIDSLTNGMQLLQTSRDELQERVTDLQCRSMKQNENTEEKLRDFIFHELEIKDRIDFGNDHRFGGHVKGKNRPIVERFLYHSDLLTKQRANKLKNSPFGINDQFPQAIEDRRRALYPIMKRHRDADDNVRLVRDRLYINNRLYEDQEIEVQPSRTESHSDETRENEVAAANPQ